MRIHTYINPDFPAAAQSAETKRDVFLNVVLYCSLYTMSCITMITLRDIHHFYPGIHAQGVCRHKNHFSVSFLSFLALATGHKCYCNKT